MCDEDSLNDMVEHARNSTDMTRRRFSAFSLAASVIAALPPVANAAEVVDQELDIKTADGTADVYFVHPASGAAPGVLMWTDIMGLRPAFKTMAKRLAQSGYSVLVPNPFYRTRRAPVVAEGASMDDPATRQVLSGLMASLTPPTTQVDATAFVGFLNGQKSVDKKRKMGTVGYCMGGPLVFRTAAAFPDRIGAGATFHGANLVTDKPDSPHLLVPKMRGQYLIAIAENDDQKQPDAKTVLRQAFEQAKLPADVEVYPGTKHGWCPLDSMVYNKEQAERGWSAMLALYKKALG